MDKSFLIVGGDMRQLYLAERLAKNNKVYAMCFDNSKVIPKGVKMIDNPMQYSTQHDFIVLPLPASQDGVMISTPFSRWNIDISMLKNYIRKDGKVLGGKLKSDMRNMLEGTEVIDYFEREELNVLNAVPTAEGALQIAMEELPTTIFGSKILITGYGRISKALVRVLSGFGAEVTVTARKYSDLAWAEIMGCKAVHISELEDKISEYDIIFNTVPAVLLDENKLKLLKEDALVIDLASKPGGVDFETARNLGIKAVWALSLPGKVAPVKSGEIIAETILNILRERGLSDE